MNEGILLAAIFVVAVVLVARPWYKAISGKKVGCVGCPGACGQDCSCSRPQFELNESDENGFSHHNSAQQDEGL